MEIFEGVNRLLEHLHHGNTADIFRRLLVHGFQRSHVALHKVSIVAAHHLLHAEKADDQRDKTAHAQPPVEGKNQNEHRNGHHHSARQIRELVRQKFLRQSHVVIDDLAKTSAGILTEIAQRQRDDVVQGRFSHVGCRAEGGQMGTAQGKKIQQDA